MGSESFTFSRIQDNNFIWTIVSKDLSPGFLDGSIEPHEFVFASSFYFSIVFCIKGLELVFELFGWSLSSDEDDTKSALCC